MNHSTDGILSDFISKYEVDIKVETIVTEHRFHRNSNGKIVIPKEYATDVQYGNEIKTLVTTLIGQGIVASNRVVNLIGEMTGNIIRISDGTVYNFLAEFDAKATTVVEAIKTKLLNVPVMHVDETGSRCEGKNMFFRNYSNETHALYTFNPTKGKKAIVDDGILPNYMGTLVHDHNTVNYNYGTNNGECNVHLIRYLKANTENTNNLWSDDITNFLLTINQTKKLAQTYGLKSFDKEKLIEYSRTYDKIVCDGYKSLADTKSRVYKKEEKALLNRLKKYKDNHLLFAFDFDVPFDNNLSERDLRIVKTKTKVSGSFRSLSGGKRYANLMSIIKTAIKQKISPYKILNLIFQNAIATM